MRKIAYRPSTSNLTIRHHRLLRTYTTFILLLHSPTFTDDRAEMVIIKLRVKKNMPLLCDISRETSYVRHYREEVKVTSSPMFESRKNSQQIKKIHKKRHGKYYFVIFTVVLAFQTFFSSKSPIYSFNQQDCIITWLAHGTL